MKDLQQEIREIREEIERVQLLDVESSNLVFDVSFEEYLNHLEKRLRQLIKYKNES